MGKDDYVYLPVATDPNGQPIVGPPKRSRARIIARLVLVLFVASVATRAAVRYTAERRQEWVAVESGHLCGRPGPRLAAFAEQLAKVGAYRPKHRNEYNAGKLVKCYAPQKDVRKTLVEDALAEVTIPQITLDTDAVYFFDIPDVPSPGSPGEDIGEHPRERSRWNTGGTFALSASDDVDKITIDSKIAFRESLFAQVCTWERENGALGVGVLVPPEDPNEDRVNYISFDVKVPSKEFKSFETALWNYTQTAGDLHKVLFKTLSLVGVNGGIEVERINALAANVTSINGNLTGSYTAQDALAIVTVNGLINVDVAFTSSSEDGTGSIGLHTVNGGITASVALDTPCDAEFPGSFKVSATTANAPVVLKFTDAPAGSALFADASTISAPANVTLHPTYEGGFKVKTFGGSVQAELDVKQGVEDPEGRGRKRTVLSRPIGGPFGRGIAGDVFWGDEEPLRSVSRYVTVSTLFAPATLEL